MVNDEMINKFEIIKNRTGFDKKQISHDLADYYCRISNKKSSSDEIVEQYGSLENYVDILYWLKFVKKFNYTQIESLMGNRPYRAYARLGWGYDTYDFDECVKLHEKHLSGLETIKKEFKLDLECFLTSDFEKRTENAHGIVNRKLLAYYGAANEDELIKRLYYYYYVHKLKTHDIGLIYGFSSRAIERLLVSLGMNLSKEESVERATQNRDYSRMHRTMRHTIINSIAYDGEFGSRTENLLRTMVATKLEDILGVYYELIVGLNNRSIITPYEIDIPIILIDKKTKDLYKIAVEVDGENFHKGDKAELNDKNKDIILEKNGWKVVRARIPDWNDSVKYKNDDIADDIANSVYDIVGFKANSGVRKCPLCAGELVKRVASRGAYSGNVFWGCSNYPACRYIENVSAK